MLIKEIGASQSSECGKTCARGSIFIITVFFLVDLRDGLRDDAAEGDGAGGRWVSRVTHVMCNLLDILQGLLSLLLLKSVHHVLIRSPRLLRQRHQLIKQRLNTHARTCTSIQTQNICVCVSVI